MAYSAGDTILDDEYNTFVNSSSSPFGYNHFAGPGASNYGLNQSTISTVSAGDTINASHWNAFQCDALIVSPAETVEIVDWFKP